MEAILLGQYNTIWHEAKAYNIYQYLDFTTENFRSGKLEYLVFQPNGNTARHGNACMGLGESFGENFY